MNETTLPMVIAYDAGKEDGRREVIELDEFLDKLQGVRNGS